MSTTNRAGIRYGFTMQAQQGSTGAHIFNATGTRSGLLPATFLESDCLAAIKLMRRLTICGTYRFVTQISATPTNNADSFNSLGHSCSRQLTPLPSTRHKNSRPHSHSVTLTKGACGTMVQGWHPRVLRLCHQAAYFRSQMLLSLKLAALIIELSTYSKAQLLPVGQKLKIRLTCLFLGCRV
jgi:hypothetical protein